MFQNDSCTFRLACAEDAAPIARLVNTAYDGDGGRAGWTNEMHLVCGQRTDETEIRELVAAQEIVMLLCLIAGEIVGSVLLQRRPGTAYLGMFVVKPKLQAAGLGKSLMRTAETLVQRLWGARRMTMTSITLRPELIEFYKRRGYRLTGEFVPFPAAERARARVAGIELAVLEKEFAAPASPGHLPALTVRQPHSRTATQACTDTDR
jgi:ribosomal protein S18 acetylase RimI-like enzyme